MNGYFGTSGMWYKSGKFYELQTTHVNFFLNKPWLLGFSQTEKQKLCVANGLAPDATQCAESSPARAGLVTQALMRGAIRIRFYRGQTSVQCYDKDDPKIFRQLLNCVIDGRDNCFGQILTVMDTKGWQQLLSDFPNAASAQSLSSFVARSKHKAVYRYVPYESGNI